MISKMKEIEVIHFDATSKVVPRIFNQFSTIFIRVKGHAIPALHILLTAKNENVYAAVLLAVRAYEKTVLNVQQLAEYKTRYLNGIRTHLEYLKSVSSTIGKRKNGSINCFYVTK